MTMGEKIRSARLAKNLSQRQLAGNVITRNMLSQIENGSAVPSMRTLEYLASVLELPAGYFLETGNIDGGSQFHNDIISAQQLLDSGNLSGAEEAVEGLLRKARQQYLQLLILRGRVSLGKKEYEAAANQLTEAEEYLNHYVLETDADLRKSLYALLEECWREREDFRLAYHYASLQLHQN